MPSVRTRSRARNQQRSESQYTIMNEEGERFETDGQSSSYDDDDNGNYKLFLDSITLI